MTSIQAFKLNKCIMSTLKKCDIPWKLFRVREMSLPFAMGLGRHHCTGDECLLIKGFHEVYMQIENWANFSKIQRFGKSRLIKVTLDFHCSDGASWVMFALYKKVDLRYVYLMKSFRQRHCLTNDLTMFQQSHNQPLVLLVVNILSIWPVCNFQRSRNRALSISSNCN